jgi:DNA-binding transcriptional MerR regulator
MSDERNGPETSSDGLTIGQVAQRTGLSVDTLRYYERIGLTPHVARNSAGRRRYSELDVAFLEFARHMRATGMSLEMLSRYVALMKRGIHTVPERLAMLESHAADVEARLRALQLSLDFLRLTISLYRAVEIREGGTDQPETRIPTWSRLHLERPVVHRARGRKRES